MESVLARKNVKFTIKNGFEAQIAHLTWVDGDVLVLLLSLLFTEEFCTRGVDFELFLEGLDLGMVIVETVTEMLLHVLNFLIWWEERKQVINFELGFLQDIQCLRNSIVSRSNPSKHLLCR